MANISLHRPILGSKLLYQEDPTRLWTPIVDLRQELGVDILEEFVNTEVQLVKQFCKIRQSYYHYIYLIRICNTSNIIGHVIVDLLAPNDFSDMWYQILS